MLKPFLQNFLITNIVMFISLSALMGMEEEIPHYVDDEISVVDIGDEALEHAEDETSEHKEFHPGKYTEAFLDAVVTNKCETFQCQWVNIGGKITQRTINAGVIPVYSSLGTTYIGGPRTEITRSSDDYICLFCKRRWYQGVHSFAPKVKIQQDGKNRVMVIYDKWLQSGSMCAKPRITDQELAFLWETTEGGLDWYIRLKRNR